MCVSAPLCDALTLTLTLTRVTLTLTLTRVTLTLTLTRVTLTRATLTRVTLTRVTLSRSLTLTRCDAQLPLLFTLLQVKP